MAGSVSGASACGRSSFARTPFRLVPSHAISHFQQLDRWDSRLTNNSQPLLGKPIGILLFSGVARLAGASLRPGLRLADLVVIGITAAIGFTVSLFFATAAFPGGAALAETKMGALLSFGAAPLAPIASRLLRGRTAGDVVARG